MLVSADIARALLAGLVTGTAVALATGAIALVRLSRSKSWVERAPNLKVPMPLVGVAFTNITLLFFTALGLLLGAAVHAAEGSYPRGWLLTSNVLFTSIVTGTVAVLLAMVAFVWGRMPWWLWSSGVVVAVAFGWALPLLAVD